MATIDEAGLVELERCARQEYPRLVRAVALVTGSIPLAEEAVQEAFVRAWERLGRGASFDHLPGWVVTVALNLARNGRSRRGLDRRARRLLAAGADGAASEPDRAVVLAVRSAVDELRGRQREAVVLYYLLDMEVTAVAGALGVSEGTVKSALSRAREKLTVLLVEQDDPRSGVER